MACHAHPTEIKPACEFVFCRAFMLSLPQGFGNPVIPQSKRGRGDFLQFIQHENDIVITVLRRLRIDGPKHDLLRLLARFATRKNGQIAAGMLEDNDNVTAIGPMFAEIAETVTAAA